MYSKSIPFTISKKTSKISFSFLMVLPHKIFIQRFLFNRNHCTLSWDILNANQQICLCSQLRWSISELRNKYILHITTIRIEFIPNSRDLNESRLIYTYAKSREKKSELVQKQQKRSKTNHFQKGSWPKMFEKKKSLK